MWNEAALKAANRRERQAVMNRKLDRFDIEAEKEASARRDFREMGALPSIMGKRISGAKHNYRTTKVASSQVQNKFREEKLGLGA